ncbi:hypothetical protein [Evansella tamaricis]|uniref:DUF3800 domain-containing protein n=1 Tax=Evansella tamaricis TaxID=2069301 RepID=A0ABS6JGA3_9BACI|nr:hypothetical protein [Evansella tamaricis]MBU9712694.1 hypothetical protein [Evansella tamaricis]
MTSGKFELWLDESGDFIKESEKKGTPSMVGGILVKQATINDTWPSLLVEQARQTYNINERYIHGAEIHGEKYGEMAVKLIKEIQQYGAEPIVFENPERVDIVSSDMTYLNILAEGIIQLLQALAAEFDEVELAILAANRIKVDGKEERKITILLKDQDYKQRLEEKIAIGMARRNLSNTESWNWSFKLDSAKTNPRLMIADVICHSWFVQNSRKFTDKTRQELISYYQPANIFSVFEHATESAIRRSLASGAIGDALFEWLEAKTENHFYETGSKENVIRHGEKKEIDFDHYLDLITKKLSSLPDFVQPTQLLIVENNLESLVSIERDFVRARYMLDVLKQEVAASLRRYRIQGDQFLFRTHLNLLKTANHSGNVILAEEQMGVCRSAMDQLAGRWETIDDVLNFLVLEGVHHMNTFNFNGAITKMNQVQRFIDTSFDLLSMSMLEDLSLITENIKSNIKGKVLGTRLQARCFQVRYNKEQLEQAVIDSDNAIQEFSRPGDLSRQYQYRSQLECEAKNLHGALAWLGKAFQVEYDNGQQLGELLQAIKGSHYISIIFGAMHYSRAMAAAVDCDEFSLAEKMYGEWIKNEMDDILFPNGEAVSEHPYQIILWKHAYYLGKTNSLKASIAKYDEAIKICHTRQERYTIRAIGLGIQCEKVSVLLEGGAKFSKDASKELKLFLKNFEQFMEEELPVEMRDFFEPWEDTLQQLDSRSIEEQRNQLFILSQKIPY